MREPWSRRVGAPESGRSRRRRTVAQLREEGRDGPRLRDALPGFALAALVVACCVVGLAWLYRAVGVGGPLLGAALLAGLAAVGARWRRVAVRRRGGLYTPAELAVLDDHGLVIAAERMLRRDGWHVISMPDEERRPRLYARDRTGRRLDVAFRPAGEAPDGEEVPAGPPTLREPSHQAADRPIRVLISREPHPLGVAPGAAWPGPGHLVDGHRLRCWAGGATLDDLGLPG